MSAKTEPMDHTDHQDQDMSAKTDHQDQDTSAKTEPMDHADHQDQDTSAKTEPMDHADHQDQDMSAKTEPMDNADHQDPDMSAKTKPIETSDEARMIRDIKNHPLFPVYWEEICDMLSEEEQYEYGTPDGDPAADIASWEDWICQRESQDPHSQSHNY